MQYQKFHVYFYRNIVDIQYAQKWKSQNQFNPRRTHPEKIAICQSWEELGEYKQYAQTRPMRLAIVQRLQVEEKMMIADELEQE